MVSDIYTKIVLTVIAGCLLVIAFRGPNGGVVHAQEGQTHVVIDSVEPTAFSLLGGAIPVRSE